MGLSVRVIGQTRLTRWDTPGETEVACGEGQAPGTLDSGRREGAVDHTGECGVQKPGKERARGVRPSTDESIKGGTETSHWTEQQGDLTEPSG